MLCAPLLADRLALCQIVEHHVDLITRNDLSLRLTIQAFELVPWHEAMFGGMHPVQRLVVARATARVALLLNWPAVPAGVETLPVPRPPPPPR